MTIKQKLPILKRFLKANKSKTPMYEKLSNACIKFGDKFLFTNGFGALILSEDFGYQHIEDDDFINRIQNLIDVVEYEKDSLDIVLTNLKENNEFVTNDNVVFNSNYLYDILKIINTTKIKYTDRINPCYCENDNGEMAILLPIRKK